MDKLSSMVKYVTAITPTDGAAGTTDITGSTVDMAGYDGCLMFVRFGTITAGAVTTIKAQSGAASDMSDAADLAGTGQTIADTDDDKIFVIDITRPNERYLRVYVDRGTQNAVVAEAHYELYRKRTLPTSQPTGVTVEAFNAPAEGTA